MRVLHISTSDVGGGAAKAAYRLHEGLLSIGEDSSMLVLRKQSNDPRVIRFTANAAFGAKVKRWIRSRIIERDLVRYRGYSPGSDERFSDDRTRFAGEPARCTHAYDIVHLHWISDFIDIGAFLSELPRSTPIVWTMHDMNLFTGGCHYTGGCERFRSNCGSCPKLQSERPTDASQQVWTRKASVFKDILRPGRVHVVADSEWLSNEARSSSLLKGQIISTIHYGLDIDKFSPRNKLLSRNVLGIPFDAKVVLFAAVSVDDRRKGAEYLLEALNGLKVEKLHLISVGSGGWRMETSIPSCHLGNVTSERFLSLVYSAADVFAMPSLEEAFGQTALEASACGTPIVAFAAGGIPEIVRTDCNGILAPVGDPVALRSGISKLLLDPRLARTLGDNGRELAVREFALSNQASRYREIYTKMISQA